MPNLYASVDYDLNGQISNNRFEVYVGVQKLGEFTKVSGIGYNTNPFLIAVGGPIDSAN